MKRGTVGCTAQAHCVSLSGARGIFARKKLKGSLASLASLRLAVRFNILLVVH